MTDYYNLAREVLARGGRVDIDALGEEALAASHADPLDLVNLSIITRDHRKYELADRIAREVLRRDPNHLAAWYELATSCLMQGLHWDAVIAVEEFLARQPDDGRALLLLARLAILVGEADKSRAARAQLRKLDLAHGDLDALAEFKTFFATYPLARALYHCRCKELSDRFIDGGEIVRRARTALAERRGFSHLRAGDGEGAFVYLSDEDEARYARLYKHNREDRARVWFNGQIDLEASGFNALSRGFLDVVANADVVGIPYATWYEHEYRIGSITGISALVNLARMWELQGIDRGQAFCRQDVHVAMDRNGDVRDLLAGLGSVGLLGCHRQLPEYMKQTFGFNEVEFHKIPGEKLFVDIIGAESAEGVHFPDRYHEIMHALDRDLSGHLFLVAGGFLGKFYCNKIKRSGGVALDIGSVVDAWLGLRTR